jgi:hypothetical protein
MRSSPTHNDARGSKAATAFLLLGFVFCLISSAHCDAAFFDYIGTTQNGPYQKPCESKDTVEKAATRDLIASAVAGDRCSIRLFLRTDARLTILNVAIQRTIAGGENVSIYLSSRGAGYYFIDASQAEYDVQLLHEGDVVAAAINQTVTNVFGPNKARQDLWWITFDQAHRVSEILVVVGDLTAQSIIAADPNPVLSPANSLTCGTICSSYLSCIGKNGRCKPFEKPCQTRTNTLLKAATEYMRADISTGGNYNDVYRMVGNNSMWTIPPINIQFTGADAIVSYFVFGDPASGLVDPLFNIVNSSTVGWIQNGDTVIGIVRFFFYAFQTGAIFETYTFWYMIYTPLRYLFNMIQNVDSLVIITNVNFYLNYTVEHICGDMAKFCVGPNEQFPIPYGPYQNYTCSQFISAMPDLAAGGLGVSDTGFSRSCRAFHLRLTPNFPGVHCNHVGGKPGLTPCVDDPVRRSISSEARTVTLTPPEQSALLLSEYITHFVANWVEYNLV